MFPYHLTVGAYCSTCPNNKTLLASTQTVQTTAEATIRKNHEWLLKYNFLFLFWGLLLKNFRKHYPQLLE